MGIEIETRPRIRLGVVTSYPIIRDHRTLRARLILSVRCLRTRLAMVVALEFVSDVLRAGGQMHFGRVNRQ